VLTITSEFSSGMIRATLAAAPRRPMVLAAKAAVLGVAGLAVGEVFAFRGHSWPGRPSWPARPRRHPGPSPACCGPS